jgi:type IV pilus assembly protein PilA
MLAAFRKRIDREDEGFTLIELMVVVLIIAILLAIAIPTFLGARERAQDRAAQSNLRNALTAEKVYYTDAQAYTVATNTAGNPIKDIEPSLTFAAGAAPTVVGTVYISVQTPSGGTTDSQVVIGAKSASGKCFYLLDRAAAATPLAAGTFYAVDGDGTCESTASISVTGTKW